LKAKSELDGDIQNPEETTGCDPILDIHVVPIDPIWAAEFRGFVWGEGSLIVRVSNSGRTIYGKERGHSFNVHIIISQRMDNGDVLREFCRRLGGTCFVKKYYDGTDKQILVWQASAVPDCVRVSRLLQGGSSLPFGKKRELAIWSEAVAIKGENHNHNHHFRYTEEARERMVEIMHEIMALRKWVS